MRCWRACGRYEDDIAAALYADLGKSHSEAYMCEIGTSLAEIRHQIAHVASWSRSRLRPMRPRERRERDARSSRVPYGVTLVMAPWNYPFLLTLEPLAGSPCRGQHRGSQAERLCARLEPLSLRRDLRRGVPTRVWCA